MSNNVCDDIFRILTVSIALRQVHVFPTDLVTPIFLLACSALMPTTLCLNAWLHDHLVK